MAKIQMIVLSCDIPGCTTETQFQRWVDAPEGWLAVAVGRTNDMFSRRVRTDLDICPDHARTSGLEGALNA